MAEICPEDALEHPSDVTLPEKYADYPDVFNKAEDDKVPAHSQHDLIIEVADWKHPFTRHHTSHLPVSLTISTIHSLSGGSEAEESEEIGEGLQDEYAHLIPVFRG